MTQSHIHLDMLLSYIHIFRYHNYKILSYSLLIWWNIFIYVGIRFIAIPTWLKIESGNIPGGLSLIRVVHTISENEYVSPTK